MADISTKAASFTHLDYISVIPSLDILKTAGDSSGIYKSDALWLPLCLICSQAR